MEGDLNLDGVVGREDLFLNASTWGYKESLDRLLDFHDEWTDEVTYPPAQSSVSLSFDVMNVNNLAEDALVYVDSTDSAHLYWLARDEDLRVQLFTSKVALGELHQAAHTGHIAGGGIHNFGGIRVAPPRNRERDYFVVYHGSGSEMNNRIVLARFNKFGLAVSGEVIASERIDNLDAVDAAVDIDENLHIAAMARAEFLDATRMVTYQKVAPDGSPLTGRIHLGEQLSGGGSSELGHPEVCIKGDHDAILLWDLGESFPTQGVRINGMTGQIEQNFALQGPYVEPDCHWSQAAGLGMGYMKGDSPGLEDFREIFFTVFDSNLSETFDPVQLSRGNSAQDDGAQVIPVGSDFYVTWREFLTQPMIARIDSSGSIVDSAGIGDPADVELAETVRSDVDSSENAHVVIRGGRIDGDGHHSHYSLPQTQSFKLRKFSALLA